MLRPHEQNEFRVSWKLCLNLSSGEWIRPRHSLATYRISLQLWQLKVMFGDGQINIKGTLMQIWKSPYMFVLIQKQYPENLAFLILRICENMAVADELFECVWPFCGVGV